MLTIGTARRSATSTVHEWLEDALLPNTDSVNDATIADPAAETTFTVANGDIASEGVICANWLAQQGFDKVGLFWEAGSSGRDYADYFRYTAMERIRQCPPASRTAS